VRTLASLRKQRIPGQGESLGANHGRRRKNWRKMRGRHVDETQAGANSTVHGKGGRSTTTTEVKLQRANRFAERPVKTVNLMG